MTLSGFRLGQDSAARPHASHHWPKGLPLSIWNQGRPPPWQSGAPAALTQTLQQTRGHSNTESRYCNNRLHRDPWRRPGRGSTPGAAPSSPEPSAPGPGSDSDSGSSSAMSQTCPSGSATSSLLAAFNAESPLALSCTARDISHYENPLPIPPTMAIARRDNQEGLQRER